MAQIFDTLTRSLTEPTLLFGHFSYLLLILSMLMRNIVWLRVLAITSGVAKFINRAFFVFDPISMLWEVIFVSVNVAQLVLIWWSNRQRNWTEREASFLEIFEPKLPPAAAATLLRAGAWVEAPTGAAITSEGEPVEALIYIAEGAVRIEAGGRTVARCSRGDFLGEMTWQSRAGATASALADGPVSYLRFERAALERALRQNRMLPFALQTGFNRNLIGKLVRSSRGPAPVGAT